MKVSELIEKLKQVDQNLEVAIPDIEYGGFMLIKSMEVETNVWLDATSPVFTAAVLYPSTLKNTP
jgi:hypothetical protein